MDEGSYEPQAASYETEPDVAYVEPRSASPIEAERPYILDAMRRANAAETAALHYLDASVLAGAFIGVALETELAAVQELANAGVHAVNTLHGQRIDSIELSEDGTVAWVQAVETWSSEYHQNGTDLCMGRAPLHEVPQTVRLVRTDAGWIVAAVEIRASGPEPVEC